MLTLFSSPSLRIFLDPPMIGAKFTGRVNLLMLFISDQFHYQNQLQKSVIQHFIKVATPPVTFKSILSICLQ